MRLDVYMLAHRLKENSAFIWSMLEKFNEWLFLIRYGDRLKFALNIPCENICNYRHKYATIDDLDKLLNFFKRQPQSSFTYFKPHEFNKPTIEKLIRNRSFLAYVIYDEDEIIGYYFLRSYCIGKAFLGKLVDKNYQGKGIGKDICFWSMETSLKLGLRMFETISRKNLSSLYCTQKVLDTKIIKELPNDYLYIEDLPKGNYNA